jgi:hypothetical protein
MQLMPLQDTLSICISERTARTPIQIGSGHSPPQREILESSEKITLIPKCFLNVPTIRTLHTMNYQMTMLIDTSL